MLKKLYLAMSASIFFVVGLIMGQIISDSLKTYVISDFHVYYYIPKAVLDLARPEHPYTNFVPIYPYFFPPASIILFKPLLFFPFYIAKYIWTIINLFFVTSTLFLINIILDKKLTYKFWLMLSALVFFYPFKFTLIQGQFNITLLFIYTLSLYAIIKNKSLIGGVVLGIGTITKISPAIILFLAFIRRKYKLIIYSLLTIGILLILTEIFVKPGINLYYVRHVIDDVSKQAAGPSYRDQSILAFYRRIQFEDTNISVLGKKVTADIIRALMSYGTVTALVLIFLVLDYIKKKRNILVDFSILTIIGVIGTGLTWFHQYTMLLLPLFLLLGIGINSKNIKIIGIAFLVYLGFFYDLEGRFLNKFLQLNLLWSALLMLMTFYYLKYKKFRIKKISWELKLNHKFLAGIFLFGVIIAINPLTINQKLKQERDENRIRAINYTADKLMQIHPKLLEGGATSYTHTQKLDEGYILLAKGEENKMRGVLSILLLDPINNKEYNFQYYKKQETFSLKAKLESNLYKDKFGNYYEYKCEKEKCLKRSNLEAF